MLVLFRMSIGATASCCIVTAGCSSSQNSSSAPHAHRHSCGTVPNKYTPHSPVLVTVMSGPATTCAEAVSVVRTYYDDPPEPPQGSGAFAQTGSWLCDSTSGWVYENTGHAGDCRSGRGHISMDHP